MTDPEHERERGRALREPGAACIFRGAQYQASYLSSLLGDRGVESTVIASGPFHRGTRWFEVYVTVSDSNRYRVQAVLEQFEEKERRAARASFERSEADRARRRFRGATWLVLSPLSWLLAIIPLAPAAAMAGYCLLAARHAASVPEGRRPTWVAFAIGEVILSVQLAGNVYWYFIR